jgi:ribokinase
MALLKPRRLISVGSIIADIRVEAPHLPPRGGDVLASAATLAAGGGFNILAAAARQGLPTLFAGRHGNGPYGECIRSALAHEGVGLLLPSDAEGDTGFCLVIVEPDGERSFITSPGVEARLGPRALQDIPLCAGDAIFVSGYDLAYPSLGPAIATWTRSLPPDALLVFDPGPLVAEIPDALRDAVLWRADIFTLNRREAQLFVAGDDVDEFIERLRSRQTHDALLILRDGVAGCYLAGAGLATPFVHAPASIVTAIDTTGAGDAHTGVVIASLTDNLDPVSAARRANAAAALSVTRLGSATAPGRVELDAFLATTDGRLKLNEEAG